MRSLGWLVLLPLVGTAAAAEPELVYSAPVETTLARAELRGPEAVWPELIRKARSRVDLGQFYAMLRPAGGGADASGRALEPVLAALREVGGRGVRIRFFIEKNMEAESAPSLAELARIPNAEVRAISWERLQGSGIHHAKYLVIDGAVACVGSHNFDWRSLRHTQELGVCLTEPQVVAGVQAIFEKDFNEGATGQQPAVPAPLVRAPAARDTYLVASPAARNPAGVGDAEAELLRLIGAARSELAVQLLLYAPFYTHGPLRGRYYGVLDQALRAAATRGVRVRMLVSSWNADRPAIQHLKSLALLPNVEIRMVTIPEAKGGFIPFARVVHSKFLVIDGETLWLGTSNWVGGYLDASRNLELVLHRPELAKKVRGLHQELWDSPYAEPLRPEKEYPLPRRR